MTTPILSIPLEIIEQALVYSDPRDVASFSQTCSVFYNLVYRASDQHIWRKLFLEQQFDHLQRNQRPDSFPYAPEQRIDWKQELQKRVNCKCILNKADANPENITKAIQDVLDVLQNAPSMIDKTEPSEDILWANMLIKKELHPLWHRSSINSLYENNLLQDLAKVWSLIGWRDNVLNRSSVDIRDTRNCARAFVYDMRNYRRNNNWGPFLPMLFGQKLCPINWDHIKWIITVMYNNLLDLGNLWTDTRPPASFEAIRAYSAPNSLNRDPKDWAGVEGTWRRYVCFMDYRDLFTYNYSNSAYDSEFFEDEDFQEATRLIELNLTVTRIGEQTISRTGASSALTSPVASSSHSPAPSDLSGSDSTASQPAAIVSNARRSRGGNGNESKVRGRVYKTTDGCIRWCFASIYDGHSQWRSEGIQIGNVCSAAGIVGTWTGAHHEEGDPAGPFWLWKVDNDHPSHLHD